jgi:hypothetical protein
LSKIVELTQLAIRQARRLFHLLVGLAFLALGVAGAIVSYGEWRIYERTPADGPVKFWVVMGFTVLLFILGLYSFAKARSVR